MLFAALTLSSCAHTDEAELPTLHMEAQPLKSAADKTTGCTGEKQIEIVKGGRPRDAVEIVPMTVKADRAVPFWMFEEAVRQRAAQYCCDGVSVLVAVAEPGDALFHEVKATGWRKQTAAQAEGK